MDSSFTFPTESQNIGSCNFLSPESNLPNEEWHFKKKELVDQVDQILATIW
jgi:hypothetical protein